jgi:hypothetical protein
MKDMQFRIMPFGHIDGMKEGDVCIFRKIGTKQYVIILYHSELL